jgi:uncharacterized YigZ family protein
MAIFILLLQMKYNNLKNSEYIRTIKEKSFAEITIKHSKFIGQAFPTTTINEVNSILKEIRTKYNDATHNCFAYFIGNDKSIFRYSDDGEPNGTAGKPIAAAIQENDLTNILVVVTRYFGGVKLGTSGLFRAYYEAAKESIFKAEIITLPITVPISFTIDYSTYAASQNVIFQSLLNIKENFGDMVEIIAEVPRNKKDEVINKLINLSNGKIMFNK